MAAFGKTPKMMLSEGVAFEEILFGVGCFLLTKEQEAEAIERANKR